MTQVTARDQLIIISQIMKNVENVCNANFPEKMKNVKIQPNLPDCPPPPISTSLFMNSAEVTRESSFPTKTKTYLHEMLS